MRNLSLLFALVLASEILLASAVPVDNLVESSAEILAENLNDQQYRWLYEELIPQKDREAMPNESFKTFRVHLKDSFLKFPKPSEISVKNLNSIDKIEGTILYAGLVRKKYKYDVLNSNNQLILNVRVHLQNATEKDLVSFGEKLKQAETLWNNSRVESDFDYAFKFELATKASGAHFSVRVLDTTRGPYDTNWGRHWTANVIAHEVGHMLGLGDEYQTVSGNMDCLLTSLMCTAWKGSLMPHHYYFVLRRLIH